MGKIEIKVNPSATPTDTVNGMCLRAQELRGEWERMLIEASSEEEEELAMPCYLLSEKPSRNFQVIGMLYKVICPFLREHEYPNRVLLTCLSEEDATMYRQIYNFYIPNRKAERMDDAMWE